MSLRSRAREHTVSLLLDAAAEAFAESGYHGTSMEDVAKRAQCAPATLYSYFAGKQQLFERLVMDRSEDWMGKVEEVTLADASFADAYRAFVELFASWGEEQSAFLRVMVLALFSGDGSVRPDLERARADRERYHGLVAALMRRGVEQGELRRDAAPDVLAVTLIGALHSIACFWLLAPGQRSLAELTHEASTVFLHGAAAQEAR
jgi:TetR/AcrR family fatty acid metabolism transcriptional regulator